MTGQESFSGKTAEYLAWFKAQPGTTFHPDIEIQDLRSRGAGRGIGTFIHWEQSCLLAMSKTNTRNLLVATSDIPAETVLFTIPRQSIICKDTSSLVARLPEVFDPPVPQNGGDDDDDGDQDMDGDHEKDDKSQDSWTTLILILIHEHLQGAVSQWKPYLDVLPASAAEFSTPMFWSAPELAELQASPVASKVGRDEAEKMIRTKIVPVVTAHEDVFYPATGGDGQHRLSEDELVQLAFRMGSVIMAYAFDLEKDDEEEDKKDDEEEEDEWVEDREGKTMLGMVPMADILNADATFNAHIEHGEQALTATALRPIAKGEEILNYYGPLSNGELLRRYGYVTRTHRRWNLVDLSWETFLAKLKREVALSEKEWEKLLSSFVDEDGDSQLEEGFIIDRDAEDPDSEGRVHDDDKKKAELPEELLVQMKEVMKVVKELRPDAVTDKTSRDRLIYAAIAQALVARAQEYSTTLTQDLELYEERKTSSPEGALDRKTMALDVRIGEKVLLQEVSEAVRVKLAKLTEVDRGDTRSAKRQKR